MIPPDKNRCQCEKPNPDYGPFRMGGSPKRRTRCSNVPTVIAIERNPGADGLIGSMSLCDECKAVFEREMPDHCYFTEISHG